MVGMAVRNYDHVNILRLIDRLAQLLDQKPLWQPTSACLGFALQRTIADVEQDELPTGC